MLKPKSNEKPKKQIGYLKRAREMQELAHANFEPERGDKSLSRIHKNIIKPRFGNTYRTFLRAMNMTGLTPGGFTSSTWPAT